MKYTDCRKLTREQILKKINNLISKRYNKEELQEYLEGLEIQLQQEGYND